MFVRGLQTLEPYVQVLPCSTQQALFQLRERLKLQGFKNINDVRRFEPRSLEVTGNVFFPFQGDEYWLVTQIMYEFQSIKMLKIIHKNELDQRYYENITAVS